MLYHLGQWSYGLWLWWMSVRHRVDLAVISQGTHWHMLALMAVCGVRVVPSIHTSFWPRGHRRSSPGRRLVWRLDRWFWNRGAWATLALSSEIQRQLGEIAGQGRGPVLRWRLRFPSGLFERLPPADHAARPFRILYGGRLVRTKGVFEMLDVADRLERQRPGGFAFEMCGEGEDAPDLRRLAADRGLQHVFELPGQLGRSELLAALGRCHAVVVPTTAAMTEGFARSAAEAVMARRPVVVSSVVPAVEDLAGAAVEVAASDIEGYVRAFQRLADDPAYYAGLVHGCQSARGQFERAGRSWGDAVRLLFRAAREARPAAWALEEFARA
jgi:glycosyltransferase involved in cell wall biosynthesis